MSTVPTTVIDLNGYSVYGDDTPVPFAFPVRIAYHEGKFWVEYGEQCKTGLTYTEAARELGVAIMHALICDGNLMED
jgi:hypothetical protein